MSDTLDRLLKGALTGIPVRFRSGEQAAQEEVGNVLPFIPMHLSQAQGQALRNAWSSDLSYIQGPPGTGKSHTIAALMISALLLERRVLLVSHKRAAIDVVRDKLRDILGDDVAIYVGADATQRTSTRGKIQALVSDVQNFGYLQRVGHARSQEKAARESLSRTLTRLEQQKRVLIDGLERTNKAFRAQEEHLRVRAQYSRSFGDSDLCAQVLGTIPEVSERWDLALDMIADVQSRRSAEVSAAELLRTRLHLAKYKRDLAAHWVSEQPWNVHRLHTYHRALTAYTQAKSETRRIQADLNQVRLSVEELSREATEHAKTYVRKLYRRVQLENARDCIPDLVRFASLFRLRAPHLVRPLMEQVDYDSITRVFPLWLGEMRNLGSVLPFESGIFDLAVVDEASQVNIAEVLPAFHRADAFVVVGDTKQLGLEAAGLFSINRTFEELTWNRCFGGVAGVISYQNAHERRLAVSTSSILDFVASPSSGFAIPRATLDEHFRSMPALARFTSEHFYRDDGGLKIMTEVGENFGKDCFEFHAVGGQRAMDGKYVLKEVEKALDIVRSIATGHALGNGSALRRLGFRDPDRYPSVGIISFTTMQRDVLRQLAEERLDDASRQKVDLLIGTPEEFQGNERDVIVITFAVGAGQRYAAAHYERPNRFNVATSRARKYTYAVIGECPPNARLLRKYFASFGVQLTTPAPHIDTPDETAQDRGAQLLWKLDARLCESEFELLLLDCLHDFIDAHGAAHLKLFNQVTTCGQKRLDFVLLNEETGRSVAVEVDGPDHFCADGKTYHQEHLDRVSVLRRAGWRIVHVPHFEWYQHGWLFDRHDPQFAHVHERFCASLREALGVESGRRRAPPLMRA